MRASRQHVRRARLCATLFIAYSTLLMSPSWPENVRRQPGWRWSQSLAVWSHEPETNTDGACGIIDTLRMHAHIRAPKHARGPA